MSVSSQSGRAHRLEKPQRPTCNPTWATTWPTPSASSCWGNGPLLLDEFSLSFAEGPVDVGGVAGVDNLQAAIVDAGPVAGIFEHGERLAAAEQQDFGAFQPAPVEIRVGRAPGQEEAVHLVDLGKMDDAGLFAFRQGPEGLAERRLDDMGEPSFSAAMAETPGGETDQSASSPSSARKPPAMVAISGE